jgi:hypothetical protein
MVLLLLALILDVVSAPHCVSQGDKLACGYQCASSLGQIACTQTPEGLCAGNQQRVVCWDPPPDVRQLLVTRDDVERPQCVTSLHGVACGFHCAQTGDRVACANSPMGACGWRFGELRCWDPAPEVRWAMEAQGNLEPAECERTLDHVVCGYHCVSTLSQVRCAQSPWGVCDRHFETLACWDPQLTVPLASLQDPR